MDFLTNAFKSLANLNEEVFDLSIGGENQELKDFLDNDDEIDTLTIIDDEAENEEELEDSYMGKVILDCNVCHSLIYKNPEDVVIDDEVANIEEECPYCYSQDGYKVVGQVKPFEDAEEDAEQAELEDKPEEDIEDEEEASDDIEDEEPEEDEEDDDDEMEESIKIRRRSAVLTEGKIQIPTVTNNNSDKVRKALKAVYEEVRGLTDKVNSKLKGVDEKKLDKVKAFCDKKVRNKYYEIITEAFSTFPISRKLMLKYLSDGLKSADSVRGFREFFVTIKQKFYNLASNVNLDSIARYDGSGEKDNIASNGRLKQNVGNNMDKYFAQSLGFDIDMDESLKESVDPDKCKDILNNWIDWEEADDEAENALDQLRSLASEGEITDDEYDYITQNWDSLLESCGRGKCDDEELDEFLDFGCVNAQGQTIGVGVGGGTGISNGQAPGIGSIPGVSEELDECDDKELDESKSVSKEDALSWLEDHEQAWEDLNKQLDVKKASMKDIEEWISEHSQLAKDYEDKFNVSLDESLKEDFNKVDIETDNQHLSMESDESGKVTVTTEPKQSEGFDDDFEDGEMSFDDEFGDEGGEAIGAVDLDTEEKIEDNQEPEEGEEEGEDEFSDEEFSDEESGEEEGGEEEFDVDEFDEESFDDLGESYLKKIYENVDSYKTTAVSERKNRLIVEGVIKFNSGAKKKTQFVFENSSRPRNGRVMLEGCNKQITRAKKGFGLTCSIANGNKLVCERLRYRYNVNKSLVEGFVGRNK